MATQTLEDVVRERVEKGAALLDKQKHGWFNKIDLDKLKMDHCRTCVIGQLYGEFNVQAFIKNFKEEVTYKNCGDFGFDVGASALISSQYLLMSLAWKEEILKRQGKEAP